MTFALPPTGEQRTIKGTVVRVKPNEEDPDGVWRHEVAISFGEVDEDLELLLEEANTRLSEPPG